MAARPKGRRRIAAPRLLAGTILASAFLLHIISPPPPSPFPTSLLKSNPSTQTSQNSQPPLSHHRSYGWRVAANVDDTVEYLPHLLPTPPRNPNPGFCAEDTGNPPGGNALHRPGEEMRISGPPVSHLLVMGDHEGWLRVSASSLERLRAIPGPISVILSVGPSPQGLTLINRLVNKATGYAPSHKEIESLQMNPGEAHMWVVEGGRKGEMGGRGRNIVVIHTDGESLGSSAGLRCVIECIAHVAGATVFHQTDPDIYTPLQDLANIAGFNASDSTKGESEPANGGALVWVVDIKESQRGGWPMHDPTTQLRQLANLEQAIIAPAYLGGISETLRGFVQTRYPRRQTVLWNSEPSNPLDAKELEDSAIDVILQTALKGGGGEGERGGGVTGRVLGDFIQNYLMAKRFGVSVSVDRTLKVSISREARLAVDIGLKEYTKALNTTTLDTDGTQWNLPSLHKKGLAPATIAINKFVDGLSVDIRESVWSEFEGKALEFLAHLVARHNAMHEARIERVCSSILQDWKERIAIGAAELNPELDTYTYATTANMLANALCGFCDELIARAGCLSNTPLWRGGLAKSLNAMVKDVYVPLAVAAALRKDIQNNRSLSALSTELTRARKAIGLVEVTLRSQAQAVTSANAKISELSAALQKAAKEKGASEGKIANLEAKIIELHHQKNSSSKDRRKLNIEITDLLTNISQVLDELNRVKRDRNSAQERIDKLSEELVRAEGESAEAKYNLKIKTLRIESLENLIRKMPDPSQTSEDLQLERLKANMSSLLCENKQLKSQVETWRANATAIKRKMDSDTRDLRKLVKTLEERVKTSSNRSEYWKKLFNEKLSSSPTPKPSQKPKPPPSFDISHSYPFRTPPTPPPLPLKERTYNPFQSLGGGVGVSKGEEKRGGGLTDTSAARKAFGSPWNPFQSVLTGRGRPHKMNESSRSVSFDWAKSHVDDQKKTSRISEHEDITITPIFENTPKPHPTRHPTRPIFPPTRYPTSRPTETLLESAGESVVKEGSEVIIKGLVNSWQYNGLKATISPPSVNKTPPHPRQAGKSHPHSFSPLPSFPDPRPHPQAHPHPHPRPHPQAHPHPHLQAYAPPPPKPTLTPTPKPTLTPTPKPTLTPTPKPTLTPAPKPTLTPTPKPTLTPTPDPIPVATPKPTPVPTLLPTLRPTSEPTLALTIREREEERDEGGGEGESEESVPEDLNKMTVNKLRDWLAHRGVKPEEMKQKRKAALIRMMRRHQAIEQKQHGKLDHLDSKANATTMTQHPVE
ncbi:hypothetical protein AAMO2058_000317200 [Amorphochlora amoebiformis]